MEEYRYEIKFILDTEQSSKFHFLLSSLTSMSKAFPDRLVNSIYYDDSSFSSIQDNLMGISHRQKMRLRWYGDNVSDKRAIFEIKKRNGRLGCKDSVEIEPLDGAVMKLPLHEISKIMFENLASKGKIFYQHLYPALQVSYKREYFSSVEGIRITLDKNISFSNRHLYKNISTNSQINYPLSILEIKFSPQHKTQAHSIIKSFDLTPKRHSKYIAGMAALGLASYV